MKNIIQFLISNEDNTYTAEGVNVPIVTEGKTFEELKINILDAVKLFFKGENSASLGFGPMPSILTSFELPSNLYGSNA
ncbi:MAG: hypothetical protein NT077_00260 [Candidatus Taylorbacteria bacterium]|nr:hypothetical protein [Candidatus Taylorbacteria bacterium]